MPDDEYDWADDDMLNAEETLRIFEALGPDVEITGPPTTHNLPLPATAQAMASGTYVVANLVLRFEHQTTEAVVKPATSGSFDERRAPTPGSTRQTYEPRQPVLFPST